MNRIKNLNTRLRVIASVFLGTLLLTGCTSQSLPKERLPEFSVITVQLPGFKPQQGDPVTWLTDLVVAGDFPDDIKDWATEEITTRVGRGLIDRGFTLAQTGDSKYLLVAALVAGISDELLDEQKQLLEMARMYPMLGGGGAYERNMLIVALTTREKVGDGNPLWKAAVEVYSADELKLSKATKLQRLDTAIEQLLSTLPDMTYTYQ